MALARLRRAAPWRAWSDVCRKHPYLVSGTSSAGMLAVADVCAQGITCPGEPWDGRRTLSMASWGVLWYGGPQCWLWTRLYPRLIGTGTTARAIASGFADCCVNAPFIMIPCFYVVTGSIKGQSCQASREQLRAEWHETATGMATFWLPFQCLNMRFTPPHLQTFLVSLANVVNKSWMSWVSNRRRVQQRHGQREQPQARSHGRSNADSTSVDPAEPQLPTIVLAGQPAGHIV